MANGFDDFTMNPWAQMGLNIMAANQPGRSPGQAVSGGMLRGLMTVKDLQKDKERSELRKTQAQLQKAQLERLKQQAEQDAQMRQHYQSLIGTPPGQQLEGPTRTGAPLTSDASGLFATDPRKAQILAALPAKTGIPLMMNQEMDALKMQQRAQQWQAEQELARRRLAQQGQGTYAGMNVMVPGVGPRLGRRNNKTGQTEVEMEPGKWTLAPAGSTVYGTSLQGGAEDIGLTTRTKSDLQAEKRSVEKAIPLIEQLEKDIKTLPTGVGGISDAAETAAGWFGQAADWGVPFANTLSEFLSQEVVSDGRTVDPQTITTRTANLKYLLKPVMGDKGPLSKFEQKELNTALANSTSADSSRRISALRTLGEIMYRNQDVINEYFNRQSVRPDSGPELSPEAQAVYEKYKPGAQ